MDDESQKDPLTDEPDKKDDDAVKADDIEVSDTASENSEDRGDQEEVAAEESAAEAAPAKEVVKQTITKEKAAKDSKPTEKVIEKVIVQPMEAEATPGKPVVMQTKVSRKWPWIVLVILILLAAGGAYYWHFVYHKAAPEAPAEPVAQTQTKSSAPKVQGLQLDTGKSYGNKYADGVLPVGDGKYTTSAPKQGYVYACSQYATNLSSDKGGADTRGPWFTNNNTEYDVSKKVHVNGSVMWQADFSNKVSGTTRTIITNDLPTHPTGIFPIASTDPAFAYDRNPNTIKGQSLTYTLTTSPTYSSTPNCMGGESGIMLTGVALFNAFDAGGRDAGAWEVQDSCSGHPQSDGIYHYHTLSSCIKDISVHTVIGYALDGFPITGPQVAPNNILTTSDLDECHGITSQITLDGKTTTSYHYVMTQDFPYSVSCFRSTAATPPDLQQSQAGQNQQPQAPPRP